MTRPAGQAPTTGLEDAPNDGTFYGRKSDTWAQPAVGDVSGLSTALSAKAPLESPAFTGTPTGPTPAFGTSTTQLATAAMVALASLRVRTINTLADLDIVAPSIAGVRTLNQTVVWTGDITMPNGERIVFGALGTIFALSSATCRIVGNYDGPILSGPLVVHNLAILNNSAGVNAEGFAVTSAVGRVCRLEYISVNGTVRGGSIGPVDNVVSIDRALVIGCAVGIRLVPGQVTVITELSRCGFQLAANSVAILVPNFAIIARALSISNCAFITSSSADRGIRIESGVILGAQSPMIAIQITGSTLTSLNGLLTGRGAVLDTGAGTLARSNVQLALAGNVSEPDSLKLADADFASSAAPITTTWVGPAPTAWVRIAHQNAGATAVLTLLSVSARFTLVRNLADPLDWYVEYTGPNRANAMIELSVISAAVAGGGSGEVIEYRVIKSTGGGGFSPVTNSDRPLEQRTAYQTLLGTSTDVIVTGDRFAIEHRNTTGTGSTKTAFYHIVVRGT